MRQEGPALRPCVYVEVLPVPPMTGPFGERPSSLVPKEGEDNPEARVRNS